MKQIIKLAGRADYAWLLVALMGLYLILKSFGEEPAQQAPAVTTIQMVQKLEELEAKLSKVDQVEEDVKDLRLLLGKALSKKK